MSVCVDEGNVFLCILPGHTPAELIFHHRAEFLSVTDHGNTALNSQSGIYYVALFRVTQQGMVFVFAPGGDFSRCEGGAIGMVPLLGNG